MNRITRTPFHFGSQSVTFLYVSAPKVNMTATKLICVIHSHPGSMWPNFCIGSELHVLQSVCPVIMHLYWVTMGTFGVVPSTGCAHLIQLKYTHILHFFPKSNWMPSRIDAVEVNCAIYLVAFIATMRFNSGMLSTVLWKAMKHGHGWDWKKGNHLYQTWLP